MADTASPQAESSSTEPEVTTPTPPPPPVFSPREARLRLLARWGMVGIAIYVIGSLIVQAQSALTPFIIGLVLAYLLLPIVNRLNRRMPRWLAILLVYIIMGIMITASIRFIVPPVTAQIGQAIDSIPSLTEFEQMGADLLAIYRRNVPIELREPIDSAVTNAIASVQANLTAYAQSLGSFAVGRIVQVINTVGYLAGLLIIPIWLFFVLNDQAKGSVAINEMVHPRARADFWNVWSIINAVLSNYVRGQLILGFAVGTAVGIGLLSLQLIGIDMQYILLLSILAGITELIPILGPIIGAVPAVLIGFSISPTAGVAVLILYILIQQLENNFLVPRIVGESIGIHPAVLSVLLIALGQVFGLIGIILSAPAAAIARDLFVYAYQRLSGSNPAVARNEVHERAIGEAPANP
ncbi:MAG: AI-2E family transporter [Roseiflexaceae bacterium]